MITVLLLVSCTEDKRPLGGDPGSEPETSSPTGATTSETPPVGECALEAPAGGPVPVVSLCHVDLVLPQGPFVSPPFGHLDDDNRDGVIGPGDVPDMVLTRAEGVPLEARSGDGRTLFSLPVARGGQMVMIDAEGDGESELYVAHDPTAYDGTWQAQRWSADGALVWTSASLSQEANLFLAAGGRVTAGDFDGDGIAELVFGEWVLDAVTGEVLRHLQVDLSVLEPALADLDGDGTLEILQGRSVYGASDAPLWTADRSQNGVRPLALDLDGDPELEVVMAGSGPLAAYEPDGQLLWQVEGGEAWYVESPCVADFDGDGELEIGAPVSSEGPKVIERDGSILWEAELDATTGCAAVDLDGDADAEMLVSTLDGLWILDGSTGEPLFHDPEVGGNVGMLPLVVDFDGDGKAEIVAPSDPQMTGLGGYRVYDSPLWPGVGPQWSMSDFSDERLTPTGLVLPPSSGLLRSRTVTHPGQPGESPLLQVEMRDICALSCEADGEVQLSVIVRNVGAVQAEEGQSLQIFSRRQSEVVLVAELPLPAIPAGTALDAVVFELPPFPGPDELFAELTGDDQCLTSRVLTEPCE